MGTNINIRLGWIDVAKGLGIFLVIFGHIISGPIFQWIFSFHMPLFFFLSGFTTKIGEENPLLSIKKIIKNLVLPYFIFVGIGFLITLLHHLILGSNLPLFKTVLFEIFIKGQPNSLGGSHLWFFTSLIVVQFLFLIIQHFSKRTWKISVVILLFVSISIIINSIMMNKIRLPFMFDSSLMAISFFYIGYLFKEKHKIKRIFEYNIFIKICIILGTLLINLLFCFKNSFVNIANNSYGNPFYYFISSLAGVFFVLLISSILQKNRILQYYGKNTLSIFAFHYFLLPIYAKIISIFFNIDYHLMQNIPILLCISGLVLICLISVPIALIYNNTIRKWINKIPILVKY